MENNMHGDEVEIDLREIFYALKKRAFLILAVALLCGCLSCVYTKFFMTPIYTSTSSMLVLTKETTLSSLADLQIGSQVIENLNLKMGYRVLRENIVLENPEDTRILNISVTNSDPELAKEIVDELATVASEYIGDKMEVIPPKIIEKGELPIVKTSPSMTKNTFLGLMLGFVLSAGIVVVITVMNDSIKTEDDIEKYLGISTLAVIPDRKDYIGQKKSEKRQKKKSSKGGRA